MIVHAEITYTNENDENVHSDVCPPGCDIANVSADYRAYLHTVLDEWLDYSKGTGYVYIGEETFSPSAVKDEADDAD